MIFSKWTSVGMVDERSSAIYKKKLKNKNTYLRNIFMFFKIIFIFIELFKK